MTAASPVRLRADARRNRGKIISTAVAAFAEDGPNLPMEEIARLAGVGVGTLYRHFPDRQSLVLAVVEDSLAAMLARAHTAVEVGPRAWDALIAVLGGSPELRFALRTPSLFQPAITEAIRTDPRVGRIRHELIALIEELVEAAKREGTLRTDVGAGDVTHLFAVLLHESHRMPGEVADRVYERAREIVLDGLRARPGGLPGRALTVLDLTAD
ncbi:TetR family transcriptional regulator [Frankia sp. CcI49]|uniref:TetR/AcrR family transcriptional regulator n=1 Tax=unclassified Frankia TaxID=2632575 RepID=UPI0006CA448F|nr:MULTISPECIES: TetR/AcrR family transcriptional regulator [unclassified Frankia]KPM53950.1 TetR family transcriptional regulator [Frankia sp. R43]ONH61900.1 TetR family transcriptional regulator [Frankia sp. CcI49]